VRLPDGCHPKRRGACGCNPALTKYFLNVPRNKLIDFLLLCFLLALCFYPYFSVCLFCRFLRFFLLHRHFAPPSSLLLSRDPGCLASFFHTGAIFHSITGLAWRTRDTDDLQRSAHMRHLSLSHPTIRSATLLHWIHSGDSRELMFLRRDADGWKEIRATLSHQSARLGLRFLNDYLTLWPWSWTFTV